MQTFLRLATALAFLGVAAPLDAKVFHARDQALELAFPDAERVETRDLFLTPEQRSEIQARAAAPVESSLITAYVGWRGGEITGFAFLDTHTVRTLPETLLIVLDAQGIVRATHLLAFYEPLEYAANERWRQQFEGARNRDSDELRVGRRVAAVTGSTLTSRAVTAAVRRSLALHAVMLAGDPPEAAR